MSSALLLLSYRQQPSVFLDVTGVFNHASLSVRFPTFQQFVNCTTRENKTLDLFYAKIRDAYSSSAQPALDNTDHNLVYLYPPIEPSCRGNL